MLEIYGAAWCVPCKSAKRFLDRSGVSYNYSDVETQPEALERIQELGYSGVPVFVLGGEHWQGFNLEKLQALV